SSAFLVAQTRRERPQRTGERFAKPHGDIPFGRPGNPGNGIDRHQAAIPGTVAVAGAPTVAQIDEPSESFVATGDIQADGDATDVDVREGAGAPFIQGAVKIQIVAGKAHLKMLGPELADAKLT